jgi:hypothetical protein
MSRNLSPQFGSPEYHRQVTSGEHPPAMMATPEELVQTHHLNDMEGGRSPQNEEERLQYGDGWDVPFRSKEDLMSYKEQDRPHLTQDIKARGFNWDHPIQTAHLQYHPDLKNSVSVVDGHHRLAAMYHHRREEFLPVQTTHYSAGEHAPTKKDSDYPSNQIS